MARTTPTAVRDELDVSVDTLSDDDLSPSIRRAGYLIDGRIADRIDGRDTLLADIEALIAAHLASEALSADITGGRLVDTVSQGSGELSYYRTTDIPDGPGGYSTTFWDQALELDPTGRLGVRSRGVTVSSTAHDH